MAPTLGYWNVRGLGTPIRLLLTHAGVEFEEKLYVCGPPPDFDRGLWTEEKFNLGLDFPNLPYYVDGDVKLTQSQVILRYIARKHKLDGNTEEERVRTDLVATTALDFHMDYAKTIAYNPNYASQKDEYAKAVGERLQLLTDFLGNRQFVAGDNVTFGDFVLFEYLEGQVKYAPDVLKSFPVLEQFVERVNGLESVKKYFDSPKAVKEPFNGAPAMVAGPYSDMMAGKK